MLHCNHPFCLIFLKCALMPSWNIILALHCHETSKEEIIPATVFLTGSACMLLGDFEGCSSWPTLQLYPLSHLRKAHWPLPSGTGSSCTGCYNKDTGTAGKNCCSRWSPQPTQTCSPSALCWGWKGCPEWASVPLEKKKIPLSFTF